MNPDRNMHHSRPAQDEDRRKWQDPDSILRSIGLGPGMVFADIGCGGGFFALPASKLVGTGGRVYALDISTNAIASLSDSAKAAGLHNLVTLNADAAKTVVCESCCDIVFFGIDLHDFSNPASVLENARLALKSSGKLVDLDWKKSGIPIGPPEEIRFSERKASQIIEASGFVVTSVRDSGPYHYVIEAKIGGAKIPDTGTP